MSSTPALPPAARSSSSKPTSASFQLPRERRAALLTHLRKMKHQRTASEQREETHDHDSVNDTTHATINHHHRDAIPAAAFLPGEDEEELELELECPDPDDDPTNGAPLIAPTISPLLIARHQHQHAARPPAQPHDVASVRNRLQSVSFASSSASVSSSSASAQWHRSSVSACSSSAASAASSPSSSSASSSSPAPIGGYSLVPACPLRREELLSQCASANIRDLCPLCESAGIHVPIGLHPGSESQGPTTMRGYDEELSRAGADRRSSTSVPGGRSSFSLPHTTRRASISCVSDSPQLIGRVGSLDPSQDDRRLSISRVASPSGGEEVHISLTPDQIARAESGWNV